MNNKLENLTSVKNLSISKKLKKVLIVAIIIISTITVATGVGLMYLKGQLESFVETEYASEISIQETATSILTLARDIRDAYIRAENGENISSYDQNLKKYVNEITNPNTGDFYVNAGISTNTNTSHLYLVANANKKYNGIGSSSINFKVTSFTGSSGSDWFFKYQYHTYYNRPCFYCPDSTSSSTQGMIGNTFNPFYEVSAQYLRGTTSSSSDRNMKHNIKYLDNQNNAISLLSNTDATTENNDITTEDVISFIESLNICTFEYNFDSIDEGSKQLGIIADDIENTKLFPYIGEHNSDYKEENKGKISRLYLQHLPLTTVALTACKYLLNEVKQLKEQIKKQTT